MVTTTDLADSYLARLRDLAGSTDHVQRFYLFMTDEQLADWEQELANSDQANAFYDRLLEQYRAWKDVMGQDAWAEVVAHNDALNGANRNWVIDEL